MSKGSYYKKHRESQGHDWPPERPQASLRISAAQQAAYEAGATLLIDKPLHWTSFDVVRKIRGAIRIKKVGHAGTLDPLATGLLILCTGKNTKKINEYMAAEKTYTGSITLGAITPTYDLESQPEQFKAYDHITEQDILSAARAFTGHLMQTPPIYAAIKKKGTPLYELARRGEAVDLQPRPVVIHAFNITRIELPVVSFEVRCSTGTYIRSLAHDVGAALGCGGYLSALRRTAIGDFQVTDAVSVESFLQEIGEKSEGS